MRNSAKAQLHECSIEDPNITKEIIIDGETAEIVLDLRNERIKVTNYNPSKISPLVNYLNKLGNKQKVGKVIIVAREEDWQLFLSYGYTLEAVNTGHYLGSSGFFMTKYFKIERSISTSLIDEDIILDNILNKPVGVPTSSLPTGYILRSATAKDADQLAHLYKTVFSSYPTPIGNSHYLQKLIEIYPFKVIMHGDKLVCASSAETNQKNKSAELTDCACLPEYRSKGFTSQIIHALEKELIHDGFNNLYSIARAKSQGINMVLRKLGFNYGGRLTNNCHICGQFEDMNLWHKYH